MTLVLSLVMVCVACTSATALAENKTGLGIVTTIDSSTPVGEVDGEKTNGRAQVDSTICAVTIDENNTIVSITFDTAQTRVDFAPDGTFVSDLSVPAESKRELGERYNMRGASPLGLELFEQYDNFETYCLGKTVEEVVATPLYQRDEEHTRVGDTEDLKATVSIDIGAMIDALAKAAANAK
jgi:hypothetical protein